VCLLVTLGAGVILLWAFWRGLIDVEPTVSTGTESREVTLVAIVITTIFTTLAGYLLLSLLRRRALRVWTITAGIAALLSCAGPLLATTLAAGVAPSLRRDRAHRGGPQTCTRKGGRDARARRHRPTTSPRWSGLAVEAAAPMALP